MDNTYLSRGEKRRQEILEAAHDLFLQQGFHGTSMRQIAQKTNIALSSLYNYFPGKDEVFEAIIKKHHPVVEVIPALQSAKGETIEEFLHDAINRMTAALEKRPHFIHLMFIEVVEFNSVHIEEIFRAYFPIMLQIVNRVYQNNQRRLRAFPFPIFVRTFMGLFFAYYTTETFFAAKAPLEFRQNAMDYFLDIYLHGILSVEARQ